ATPDVDPITLLLPAFPGMQRLPQAVNQLPARVEHLLNGAPRPHTSNLTLRWQAAGSETALIATGIIIRTFRDDTVEHTHVPWADVPETIPSWVAADWNPAPRIRAYTSGDGVEAAVIGLASLLAVGVRIGEESRW